MKEGFFAALVRSDTFWSETVLSIVLIIFLIFFSCLLIQIIGKRIKANKIVQLHQSGAAAAVDFVLTFPIFMFVLFLIIQFALIANASLYIHYAAYSAAHSARIHYFDTSTNAARVSKQFGLSNSFVLSQVNAKMAEEKALDAARLALISVGSPKRNLSSNPDTSSNAWRGINTYTETLSKEVGTSDADVFLRKASYSFDNYNLSLKVHLDDDPLFLIRRLQVSEFPVHADLTYKFILALPLAGKVFGAKGSHGFYYRDLNANVSVL